MKSIRRDRMIRSAVGAVGAAVAAAVVTLGVRAHGGDRAIMEAGHKVDLETRLAEVLKETT